MRETRTIIDVAEVHRGTVFLGRILKTMTSDVGIGLHRLALPELKGQLLRIFIAVLFLGLIMPVSSAWGYESKYESKAAPK